MTAYDAYQPLRESDPPIREGCRALIYYRAKMASQCCKPIVGEEHGLAWCERHISKGQS